MKEITGNLWDYHKGDNWIVITTNGFVKANGEAVMGRGVARQAVQRYPFLPKKLGLFLTENGNKVHFWPIHLVTFPVKHNWWEQADLELIRLSVLDLVDNLNERDDIEHVYMPRPGCGNGGLKWKDVRPLLVDKLDDRFTIVEVNP